MPTSLRLLLIAGAIIAFIAIGSRIKKSKILMEDAIFWAVAATILVLIALFPGIAINLAFGLGFMSPANFVFLLIITLLLWKVFTNSCEISRLKAKINELAQEVALASAHTQEEDDKADTSSTRD